MNVLHRNNVHVSTHHVNKPTLLYAHGFGCSQAMWNNVIPAFKEKAKQISFDFVGSGQSSIADYSFERYRRLEGYAQDVIEICDALKLDSDVIFIGHSVSCSIGVLVANERPNLFKKMIFLGPSPCFLNMPPDYQGGFERADLEGLLELMDQNYLGWASYLGQVVAGSDSDTKIAGQLSDSFCSTDPIITKHFAKTTFFSDNRHDYAKLRVPSLILQHKSDVLASMEVGTFLHQQLKNSTLRILDVAGHAAHMSHPHLVIDAIEEYLQSDLQS
ncbi:alpha/beta fold hydrolase [Marinomonas shanghaiensis]|jgi:sigma-B regulation protein RsbQ|uniref:alpha/beta fold hydrolase n=1 Tax=Marinomonas shanghaiensis TaxID=2202418 RepID=UPI000DB902D4|nr:alpha/beta hydrolase [Marinomonas shanghaiensis]